LALGRRQRQSGTDQLNESAIAFAAEGRQLHVSPSSRTAKGSRNVADEDRGELQLAELSLNLDEDRLRVHTVRSLASASASHV
jgi:hypothetical protein